MDETKRQKLMGLQVTNRRHKIDNTLVVKYESSFYLSVTEYSYYFEVNMWVFMEWFLVSMQVWVVKKHVRIVLVESPRFLGWIYIP